MFLVLLLIPVIPMADKAKLEKEPEIEGYYKVSGTERTDEGNKPYKGLVTVTKVNEGYFLSYSHGSTGIGIRDKDRLIISWMQGKFVGVTVMTRKGDDWEGYWIGTPRVQRNSETWKFLSSLE